MYEDNILQNLNPYFVWIVNINLYLVNNIIYIIEFIMNS